MSVVSQRPRRQYEVLHWGHVDLQEYANGRFVSNNNTFTIVFFNTYYHKQINKISISACNETFRQSSDPVYAHTPMRNVGGLRTFNPKLKDSAGGEVNQSVSVECWGIFGKLPPVSIGLWMRKVAFPTISENVEAVRLDICAIVSLLDLTITSAVVLYVASQIYIHMYIWNSIAQI